MTTVHSINTIISDPGIRNGRPVVAGTTICVSDVVVAMIYHQQDPDGIADWYGLSLAQVHAALAYYYDHKDEIDTEIREQDQIAIAFQEKRIGSRHNPLLA